MTEKKLAKIYYADLWGLRKEKYKYLLENDIQATRWKTLKPNTPYFFFVPKDFALQVEYEKFWKVTDIFKKFQIGLMTGQDDFFVDINPHVLKARILAIFNKSLTNDNLRILYNLRSQAGEKTIQARNLTYFNESLFHSYCYRPFDIRYIYAENKFLWRSVETLKKNFSFENIALVTTRILSRLPFNHVFIAQYAGDNTFISSQTKERNYFFPLYLYPDKAKDQLLNEGEHKGERIPNYTPEFLQAIKLSLGKESTPEEIFYYLYATLYSPTYRKRYEEFLKIDFPRIPLPKNYKFFKNLSIMGKELVDLHLLKHPALSKSEVGIPKSGSNNVEKVKYDEKTRRVYFNKDQYFDNVREEIWEYRIGAYQVMEKYLKDRKSRRLSLDEVNHYLKMAKAIYLTMKIQKKIDKIFQNATPFTLEN